MIKNINALPAQRSSATGVQLSFEGMPVPDERFEYKLLKGHTRTDGSYKTDEALRTEYVRLTDNLIHTMVEGVDVKNQKTGDVEKRPVDFVVWLDKSARPLSYLTRKLWPIMAMDSHGRIPDEPEHRFVNIDRNQWTSYIDPEGVGRTNVDALDASIIRSLRSIFLKNPNDRREGLTERIDESPSQLDGKQVLIVDEVRSTGRTLSYAQNLFARAFPSANLGTAYWMNEITVLRNGATGNADLPVWYSDTTEYGRGVGNRNVDRSRKSPNSVQRMGAWFLSTAFVGTDPSSVQLRKELRQLARDVKEGNMLVEPSRDRDDYEERVMRLNNEVQSLDEFTLRRKNL